MLNIDIEEYLLCLLDDGIKLLNKDLQIDFKRKSLTHCFLYHGKGGNQAQLMYKNELGSICDHPDREFNFRKTVAYTEVYCSDTVLNLYHVVAGYGVLAAMSSVGRQLKALSRGVDEQAFQQVFRNELFSSELPYPIRQVFEGFAVFCCRHCTDKDRGWEKWKTGKHFWLKRDERYPRQSVEIYWLLEKKYQTAGPGKLKELLGFEKNG